MAQISLAFAHKIILGIFLLYFTFSEPGQHALRMPCMFFPDSYKNMKSFHSHVIHVNEDLL